MTHWTGADVKPGGWLWEDENDKYGQGYLRQRMAYTVNYEDIDDDYRILDPSSFLPIEDQNGFGACQGYAISTGTEISIVLATGKHWQLSGYGAYIQSQLKSNIRSDRGSMCLDGCIVARDEGLAPVSAWDRPAQYTQRFPPGFASAPRAYIEGFSDLTDMDFDALLKHINSRKGAVHFGFPWDNNIDAQVKRDFIVRRFTASGGGHSVEGVGIRDIGYDGKPLNEWMIDVYNSWKTSWGFKGRFLLSRAGWESARNLNTPRMQRTQALGLIGGRSYEAYKPNYGA